MKKYILTLLLFAVGMINVCAQTAEAEMAKRTKTKNAPLLHSISVGADLMGPAFRYLGDQGDYQAYVQASLRGKFLPVIEIGYGNADKHNDDTDVSYKSKGPFARIGCDYNVLKNKLDDYRVMVGMRYGMTKFDYDTTMPTDSLHTTYTMQSEKCTVHWLEFAFGVDAKVWGPLHMGWSVRYRRRMGCSDYINPPLYAPGFGNASEKTSFMGLYTLSLQF